MIIPINTSVVFDGGFFSGTLPSKCSFKNTCLINATSSNSQVTFEDGVKIKLGSVLSINDGTTTCVGALTVNGSLTIDSSSTVDFNKVDGTGSLFFVNGDFSGVCSVKNITSTGEANFYRKTNGTNWTLNTCYFAAESKIQNLICNDATFFEAVDGFSLTVGNLTSNNVVNANSVSLSGVFDAVPLNDMLISFSKDASVILDKAKILNSSLNTGNYTNVLCNVEIKSQERAFVFGQSGKITLTAQEILGIASLPENRRLSCSFGYEFS